MKSLLRLLLRTCGLRLVRASHAGTRYLDGVPHSLLHSTLLRIFPSLHGLSFIQIGANDGTLADPIHDLIRLHHWRGILLEPEPRNYAKLCSLHHNNPDLRCLPNALSFDAAPLPLFFIDPSLRSSLPPWVEGLASLDHARVLQAATELGLPAQAIMQTMVAPLTWDQLWPLAHGGRADLLLLDIEGLDIPLLQAADLGAHLPRIVHFEHACATDDARFAFYRQLAQWGYDFGTDGPDTTAWRSSP